MKLRQANEAHCQRMEKCVMGLKRRKFTREFKEAAVRRLEMGASVAEVSRAVEIDFLRG